MDPGTARTGVAEETGRLCRGIRPGRRRRALRPDQRPEHDYRQHWKDLQTGPDVGAVERRVTGYAVFRARFNQSALRTSSRVRRKTAANEFKAGPVPAPNSIWPAP